MLYNVPYLPEKKYTKFLKTMGEALHSVHFSLQSPLLNDGRVRFSGVNLDDLIAGLNQLPLPRKYLLANGRYHMPDQYLGKKRISELVRQLSVLQEARVLDGIVFNDTYLLMALSKYAPALVSRMEAVPSINFILDTIGKITSLIRVIEDSGFLLPDKLALDRELNRQPEMLYDLVGEIRYRFPEIKIELLANEGCLRNCPFRATHEALIAAVNNGAGIDTLEINRQLGCVQILSEEPHRIFASPFIRPEDVEHYGSVAEIIKICGRSMGSSFLINTVTHYLKGISPKNLVVLLDAANWMAEYWKVDGSSLPDGFYQQVSRCDGDCEHCHVCNRLFEEASTILPFHLKKYLGCK